MDPEAVSPRKIQRACEKEESMPQAARHFDITEWADYARNTAPPELRSEMASHLEAGCPRCEKIEQLFAKLIVVCARESAYELPRQSERSVKALAGLGKPERRSALGRLWATLVYDSLNAPQPVGVRGSHQISRHVLFHAGDYSVDLRFEHEKGSASMVLVGQIANQKAPEEAMGNLPVILLAGKREVSRSISNSYGEFQMEYVPDSDLRLLVPLESTGQELEVLLGKTPRA
jgi:phage FluMu protein Com